MPSDNDELVPLLPPELEREIFTIAALTDQPIQLQLLLVARRVYEWIEPLIYRDIDFAEGSRTKFKRLEEMKPILRRKPAQFFESSVKSLFIDGLCNRMDALPCLRSFTGLTHLALWPWIEGQEDDSVDEETTSEAQQSAKVMEMWNLVLSLPNLRYLSLNEDLQRLAICNRQACGPVTHLDLSGALPDSFTLLSIFPRITHLSCLLEHGQVPSSVDWSHMATLKSILDMENVSILLVLYSSSADWIIDEFQLQLGIKVHEHSKLLLLEAPSWADDWRAGLQGKPNMWTRAEEILASRKSEIQQK